MVVLKDLFIDVNGIQLEAEYLHSTTDNEFAVIICHPHPQYGGSMHNNVVSAVFSRLKMENINCLRFNFRGVGNSSGSPSDGVGELEDVKACVEYLVGEKHYEKILICGYSYGAAIGCSAVNYSKHIVGFVAISFPWDFMDENFKKLSQTGKPKFFIQGDEDSIAKYNRFQEHYDDYQEPKEYTIIKGANHFYRSYEHQVAEEVHKFIKKNYSLD
ncbi:MAG: alpha/beta fold hydrolase [Promethearchaeia archaeon]